MNPQIKMFKKTIEFVTMPIQINWTPETGIEEATVVDFKFEVQDENKIEFYQEYLVGININNMYALLSY